MRANAGVKRCRPRLWPRFTLRSVRVMDAFTGGPQAARFRKVQVLRAFLCSVSVGQRNRTLRTELWPWIGREIRDLLSEVVGSEVHG